MSTCTLLFLAILKLVTDSKDFLTTLFIGCIEIKIILAYIVVHNVSLFNHNNIRKLSLYYHHHHHILRFQLSIRTCVMDVGVAMHNEIAGIVQKIITYLRLSQMAMIIMIYSVQLLHVGPQRVARYEKYANVGACHRTSNKQEHKIIGRAGPEQDMIFH